MYNKKQLFWLYPQKKKEKTVLSHWELFIFNVVKLLLRSFVQSKNIANFLGNEQTFLLIAASSACLTNALPSAVTCWVGSTSHISKQTAAWNGEAQSSETVLIWTKQQQNNHKPA